MTIEALYRNPLTHAPEALHSTTVVLKVRERVLVHMCTVKSSDQLYSVYTGRGSQWLKFVTLGWFFTLGLYPPTHYVILRHVMIFM